MLFNETTFKDTHKLFQNLGYHTGENYPAKKQEMLVNIASAFLRSVHELEKGNRANADKYMAVGDAVRTDATYIILYGNYVQGTFEDHLAHTILLCYDFAGCWRLKKSLVERGYNREVPTKESAELMEAINSGYKSTGHDMMESYEKEVNDNIEKKIPYPKAYALSILKCITDTYYGGFGAADMGVVIARLHMLAMENNVEIEKFIEIKLKHL